ncbi:TetR/AcrR family transcriptional regulator [Methyloversatilis thermotolerans]|uniref:TetR/AcrR family transcriptional regulator n=1 Tax=Methyloversatilis thermotolerans TaxID=1346290 RepID=UPI000364BF66|nr:TetR/AcrR family transcriptional regulator [Methyloversatilis thermotolerans]
MANDRYHHGDLRSALLNCAAARMESDGPDSLSMRDMARAVGVSHTAAYRHFIDKGALLDALAEQGFRDLIERSRRAVEHAAPDARSRLKASGLAYIGFGLDHPRQLAHMFARVAQPDAGTALCEAGAALFAHLCELVAAGQHTGTFRTGDARQLAQACWAQVHGLSALLAMGHLRPVDSGPEAAWVQAGGALDLFLDGLSR